MNETRTVWKRFVPWVACLQLLTGCAYTLYSVPDLSNKSVDELIDIATIQDTTPRGREIRSKAIYALRSYNVSRIAPNQPHKREQAVTTLLGLLDRTEDFNGQVGQALCSTLDSYSNDAARILPKLISVSENVRGPSVRLSCVSALARLSSTHAPQALPFFMREAAVALVKNPSVSERSADPLGAMRGIANIGPGAQEAAPLLKSIISDAQTAWLKPQPVGAYWTAWLKLQAARAYWKVTGETSFVVELSSSILRETNRRGEHSVSFEGMLLPIIFELGPAARSATPALQKMMVSEDGYCPGSSKLGPAYACRAYAGAALWRTDPSQRTFLAGFFEDPVYAWGSVAFFCHMELGELAQLLPSLRKAYEKSKADKKLWNSYWGRAEDRIGAVLRYASGELDTEPYEKTCRAYESEVFY